MHKLVGGGGYIQRMNTYALYVDGTYGNDSDTGRSPDHALATIQKAVDKAAEGWTIYVFPKVHTDYTGDPVSYAETVIIPYAKSNLGLIGVGRGRTQGGLPQIKKGSGSTALITIRAPGCLIANIGINGSGSTGGGILLDDDYAAKAAFGTTIQNCHIKNCVGSTATNSATGGGIMWTTAGNAWQVNIVGNKFYKNVGDIVLMGTTNTRPQDILVQHNIFQSSPTSSTDCNINGAQGGFQSIVIDSNVFGDVPALGSGSVALYMDLTGAQEGMLTRNVFGAITAEAEVDVTFGAAGTAAKVPTTVFMAGNWGQSGSTAAAADGAAGEVFRT
jgi:hypothetical protein